MPLGKPLQKLTVGLFLGSPDSSKLADVPDDQAQLRVGHESDSPGGHVTGIVPGREPCDTTFFGGISKTINGQTLRRPHCLETLGQLDGLRPRTIVLHQSGLLRFKDAKIEMLKQLVGDGAKLVVLADEFFRGTTAAANRVLAPFGLEFKRDGSDEPGLSREERIRRIGDWQSRYELTPFDARAADIRAHLLTRGVEQLHWFRPCPIVCPSAHTYPLVRNSADPAECFAAVSESNGFVVAVGKSLWSGLSAVGWPYNNDRFFANLLVGGDAEAALQG